MNITELSYVVVCRASGAEGYIVSRHRTLGAAERECAKLHRKLSQPMERHLVAYTVASLSPIQLDKRRVPNSESGFRNKESSYVASSR